MPETTSSQIAPAVPVENTQNIAARATPAAPKPPSVHIRAVLTWLAIFPLVTIGMLAFNGLWAEWHPVLRSLFLTALVVPLAVYLVVPQLMKLYGKSAARAARRRSSGAA